MRCILAVISHDRDPMTHLRALQTQIDVALERHAPWTVVSETWRESWATGAVRIDVLSDEPPEDRDHALLEEFPGHVIAWTGYVPQFRSGAVSEKPLDDSNIASLGGIFAVVQVSADRVEGWTSVHRLEPLYVAANADAGITVLSTSARLAAALASSAAPPMLPAAAASLVGAGYMLSDATPFRGVEAVPADSSIVIDQRGVRVRPIPPPDVDPGRPVRDVARDVAGALQQASEFVVQQAPSLICHITGGKDSRLVLAALTSIGADFTTRSTGFPEHGDCIIGGLASRTVGRPHHVVRPPGHAATVHLDPVRRAYHAIRSAEGMLSAYETQDSRTGRYSRAAIECGGHGGELLRGGFAHGAQLEVQRARRKLLGIARSHLHLLSPSGRAVYEDSLRLWDTRVETDPIDALDALYRDYRSGRWHAVARASYSLRGPRYSVLADNRVVRLANLATMEDRASERLVYDALRLLNRDLAKLPLYRARWAFEEHPPRRLFGRRGWRRREPLRTPPGRPQFNVRAHFSEEVHAHMVSAIRSSPLFEIGIFDRSSVDDLLAVTRTDRGGTRLRNLWGLYTAAQYSAGLGSVGRVPDSKGFEVPVPD